MPQPAAIYTRVSSSRQKEEHTIASQAAALMEYAQTQGYAVPPEWVFQDEGYSGANLLRPGLEALRDLVGQGLITTVLVYSPDRLSRKYAYQVLLGEEFSRAGVELVFVKAPAGATAEDQLVVQFQGMIAEYERAQIAERSRRGKRYKAQQGAVSVLSGAPYGYCYVKKSDTSEAYYQVLEHEAEVVRRVFALYTQQHLSLGAIARQLNLEGVRTRSSKGPWERSTIAGMLHNPAYQGKACYGKTARTSRQRLTRPVRQRNRLPARNNAAQARPRQDWIEVKVPALVSEETFAWAQEQLEKNKHFSQRRTKKPTLLQGLLVCQQCGYAMYRSNSGAKAGQTVHYYYRCVGSDAYRRFPQQRVCTNRPIRQDHLDQIVWQQTVALLEQETLIQAEIDRRRESARTTDPGLQRQETLAQDQIRFNHQMNRLLTAYQEELLTLAQLRERMLPLKQQLQAVESELHNLEMATLDETKYLKLAESLHGFRSKLRAQAITLDVTERQQILRSVVKEVLVGADTLIIRHSIPVPQVSRSSTPSTPSHPPPADSYRLCTRSAAPAFGAERFKEGIQQH